jgi:AbrB family looped-hinge helix DNA binding protein
VPYEPCGPATVLLDGPMRASLTRRSLTKDGALIMRITSKGQVTIPQEIRELLSLLPNTEVDFVIDGQAVRIVKAKAKGNRTRGKDVVTRLRGRAKTAMTTDEILALTRKGA